MMVLGGVKEYIQPFCAVPDAGWSELSMHLPMIVPFKCTTLECLAPGIRSMQIPRIEVQSCARGSRP